MPVGSCLGGQIENNEANLEVIMTSSVLNQADQFAFMQQTLLMQIFRIHTGSNNTETGSSVSSSDSNSSSLCPTCIAFSDHCCQRDNGSGLFHEFIEANLHYCLWDQKLADALQSLRYQGYVCPGILVMIANSRHLELMADLWKRQLLTAPRGTRISQVGLSTGCVVRPVPLAHSISLHDVLCLILARLKQRGQVAEMGTILESVQNDWASLVQRLKADSLDENYLRDSVHSALGALIKQRKVYYTGNKGYFLVGPTENHSSNNANQGCTSLFNSTSPTTVAKLTIGSKFSQLRHSLRNHTPPKTDSSEDSPDTSLLSNGRRDQNTPTIAEKSAESAESTESSPNNSFLERSQSLRISKKSLKSLSSKGGSLRLSKKDALALKQVKEEAENEEPNNQAQSTTSKSFERKNSFLSKLFSNGSPSNNPKKQKPVLATFSAQFPPPELLEQQQQIYQQLIPRTRQFSNENSSNSSPNPTKMYDANMYAMVNRRSQEPPSNGHFDAQNNGLYEPMNNGLYESPNKNGLSNMNKNLYGPRINGQSPISGLYESTNNGNIGPPSNEISPNKNVYGSRINGQSPINALYESPNNGLYVPHNNGGLYQAPPPPLPYRPPPPNPYLSSDNDQYARVLPKNHQPPVQAQFSISTTPTLSTPTLSTPPESEVYARVSNLKKVNGSNGNSPQRNVRFADEQSSSGVTSTSSSSSSGPSSIESQKNNVYDETLVVIEKSNKELEKKLRPARIVDTIHNNKNNLAQEVIYEVEDSVKKVDVESSVTPSYPSISDLTLTDITCFKSLTAQKMMAGLSFNSIDTLLEVNAAAEARSKLNESTETVDFGII